MSRSKDPKAVSEIDVLLVGVFEACVQRYMEITEECDCDSNDDLVVMVKARQEFLKNYMRAYDDLHKRGVSEVIKDITDS